MAGEEQRQPSGLGRHHDPSRQRRFGYSRLIDPADAFAIAAEHGYALMVRINAPGVARLRFQVFADEDGNDAVLVEVGDYAYVLDAVDFERLTERPLPRLRG